MPYLIVGGGTVKQVIHGAYPETMAEALDQGALVPNQDFRGLYSSVLEDLRILGKFERF